MELLLYTMVSRTDHSELGSTARHLFDYAVLDQVMRQDGQGADQEIFPNTLEMAR